MNIRKSKKIFFISSLRSRRLCGEKSAFTLIELMIVIVIISILVGITLPIAKYVSYRARQAQQRIYIEKLKSALEDYRAAYGEYPITPNQLSSDTMLPENYNDVLRHYPAHYATECSYTSNSPYVNVDIASNTIENIITGVDTPNLVDYCLTYPLMLKQLEKGARPFMDFKEVTVAFLAYKLSEHIQDDEQHVVVRHKKKSGGFFSAEYWSLKGNPINRPEAIDPVSQKQWKYTSDGVTYDLTNHTESGF